MDQGFLSEIKKGDTIDLKIERKDLDNMKGDGRIEVYAIEANGKAYLKEDAALMGKSAMGQAMLYLGGGLLLIGLFSLLWSRK